MRSMTPSNAQRSLLEEFRGLYGVLGIESEPAAYRQVYYPLYYLDDPSHVFP